MDSKKGKSTNNSKDKILKSLKQQKSFISAPVKKATEVDKKKTTLQMICESFVKQVNYGIETTGEAFNERFRKAIESGLGRAVLIRTESTLDMKGSDGRFRMVKLLKSMIENKLSELGLTKEEKLSENVPKCFIPSDSLKKATPKPNDLRNYKCVLRQNSYSGFLKAAFPKTSSEVFQQNLKALKYGLKISARQSYEGEKTEKFKNSDQNTKSKSKKESEKHRKYHSKRSKKKVIIDSFGFKINVPVANKKMNLRDIQLSVTSKKHAEKSTAFNSRKQKISSHGKPKTM